MSKEFWDGYPFEILHYEQGQWSEDSKFESIYVKIGTNAFEVKKYTIKKVLKMEIKHEGMLQSDELTRCCFCEEYVTDIYRCEELEKQKKELYNFCIDHPKIRLIRMMKKQ